MIFLLVGRSHAVSFRQVLAGRKPDEIDSKRRNVIGSEWPVVVGDIASPCTSMLLRTTFPRQLPMTFFLVG